MTLELQNEKRNLLMLSELKEGQLAVMLNHGNYSGKIVEYLFKHDEIHVVGSSDSFRYDKDLHDKCICRVLEKGDTMVHEEHEPLNIKPDLTQD